MNDREAVILCEEAALDGLRHRGRRSDDEQVLRLRTAGSGRNVHLCIEDVSRSLSAEIEPQFVDLIQIATFVYIADQAFRRGGAGVENMGADWRRRFRFTVPVRCLHLWERDEVRDALTGLLGFLSEDEYEFEFREYKRPPALPSYLKYGKYPGAVEPEEVVLFSGGLDSLGGAVGEIIQKRRPVLLVTHEATTKFNSRYKMLRSLIDGRAGSARPLAAKVSINKDKRLEREHTQRSRSFLYASLAAAMARMCGLNEIKFYENGTVSLNLPIAREIVGAKATRTTHPRVLLDFARLFSLLIGSDFKVSNQFLWTTKAEIVRDIVEAGCGGMLEWSSSCTHTRIISLDRPHCGKCSQCIDRRFAILAGGGAQYERAESYGVDLLTGVRDPGEPRTMLVSYVETAQQVASMSEMDFFQKFGEAARAVGALGGSGEEAAGRIYSLYRRHAQCVVSAVDEGIARHAKEIRSRSLPESCLLRLVHDPTVGGDSGHVPSRGAQAANEAPYYLLRRGDVWVIRFAGHEPQILKDLVGYAYLQELIRSRGKAFSVAELVLRARGAGVPLGDSDEISDAEAYAAYAQTLRDIDAEIALAKANCDEAEMDRLGNVKVALCAQMRASTFRGKAKRNKSDLNNLRNSVCNAIRRALRPMARYEPEGHQHFEQSLKLGFTVVYSPPVPVPWSD